MPKNWAVRGSESGPIGGEGKEDEKDKKKKKRHGKNKVETERA